MSETTHGYCTCLNCGASFEVFTTASLDDGICPWCDSREVVSHR